LITYSLDGFFNIFPQKKVIEENLNEISRVLKPDGKFQIHIGLADNFKSFLFGFLSGSQREFLAKLLLGDKTTSKKTFIGVTYTKSAFIKTLLKYDLDAIPKTHKYYNPWTKKEESPIFFEGSKRKI
jgi:ubiquinone/menaquinone biosynthesis C-methylase UbiE